MTGLTGQLIGVLLTTCMVVVLPSVATERTFRLSWQPSIGSRD